MNRRCYLEICEANVVSGVLKEHEAKFAAAAILSHAI